MAAFSTTSSSDNYVYQNVHLDLGCAAQVDEGSLLVTATGWFRAEQAPDYDDVRLWIIYYDADMNEVGDGYDSGQQRPVEWTEFGLGLSSIPSGTRIIQVRWVSPCQRLSTLIRAT
jgi:hypothetical protein